MSGIKSLVTLADSGADAKSATRSRSGGRTAQSSFAVPGGIEPVCVSVEQARLLLNLGLTKFYDEVKAGRITLIKAGRRSLVAVDELRAWPRRVASAAHQSSDR